MHLLDWLLPGVEQNYWLSYDGWSQTASARPNHKPGFQAVAYSKLFNLVVEWLCSLAQKIEHFKNRFTHIPSENGMMHNRFIPYRRESGTFYIWHWQTPSRWKWSEREQCVDPEELEGVREREWELVPCTFSAPWRETSPCWKVIRRAIPPWEMSRREKLFYREKTGFQHNLRYDYLGSYMILRAFVRYRPVLGWIPLAIFFLK